MYDRREYAAERRRFSFPVCFCYVTWRHTSRARMRSCVDVDVDVDASCDATPNGPAHGRSLSTVLHIVITTNQIRGGLNESSRAHRANTSTHLNNRYLWLIVACGPCWEKVSSLLDPFRLSGAERAKMKGLNWLCDVPGRQAGLLNCGGAASRQFPRN